MAGNNASKGNPASKRMMNPRLKEKRAASWARGERRKKEHRAANELRAQNNIVRLGDLYDRNATKTVVSLVRVMVNGKMDVREVERQVSLSPSKQLRRQRRLAAQNVTV